MNSKFFTTAASNEVPEIATELEKRGFTELQPCEGSNHLFVDTVNRTFWSCDENSMAANIKMAESIHKETPVQLTLKEVQTWES
jgi:hypothetical protein